MDKENIRLSPEDLKILLENDKDMRGQEERSVSVINLMRKLDGTVVDFTPEQLETVWSLLDPAARVTLADTLSRLLQAERNLPPANINIVIPADDPKFSLEE